MNLASSLIKTYETQSIIANDLKAGEVYQIEKA